MRMMQDQKFIETQRKNRGKKITNYNHRGFDFDGAAGNDKLLTDKILNRLQTAIQAQMMSGPSIFNHSMSMNSLSNMSHSSSRKSLRGLFKRGSVAQLSPDVPQTFEY